MSLKPSAFAAPPETNSLPYPPFWLAGSTWGLATLFYLLGFYQRVAPAVMTTELMAAFGMTAAGLGNLSACYYYSYVAMQIPTGIWVDSWGPRKVLAAGGLGAALGTIVFSLAPTLFWANLGRIVIGGSAAVGFVAALKLAGHWFSPRRFATATGLALLLGTLGAVSAGVPLRFMIDAFGWRASILAAGVFNLLVAAATYAFVRDDPSAKGYRSHQWREAPGSPFPQTYSPLRGIREVFRFRNTWLLTLAPGGLVGSVLSFSGLWGVPFLQARFGLSPAAGAAVCSLLMVCWAAGGPLLGGLSDRLGKRKPILLAGSLLGTLCWAAMVFLPGLSLPAFLFFLTVGGFATGGMIVGFALVKESIPPSLAGTAMGVYNTGMMVGTPILQPLIGWILDLTWTGGTLEGVRIYTVASYQAGFSAMVVWCGLSFFLIRFAKEPDRR